MTAAAREKTRTAAVSRLRGLLAPGRIHLFKHLVDRLLTGQQALDPDAEGVVDRRVGPGGVGQASERAGLQQVADRLSPVVTDPSTNPPLLSLTKGERTGSRIF